MIFPPEVVEMSDACEAVSWSSSWSSSDGSSSWTSSVATQSSVPHGAERQRSSSSTPMSSGKMSSGVGSSRSGLNDVQKSDKFFWMISDVDFAGCFSQATVVGVGGGSSSNGIHGEFARPHRKFQE